ncbi:MAG: haloacid dehalogenase type II [Betaproteobacteria bacterium]|jgi:2-haloacid dehalogenase
MKRLRAALFDVFGTLLDVQSVAARADALFPGQGAALARAWRDKQIEYTRLRALSNRYAPFTQVTEDALCWCADALGLPLDAAVRGLLMHEYTQLACFADVRPALARLQQAGATLGVLSNGDPGLLDEALESACLAECFDLVLSAEDVHSFKTAAAVYELGPRALGHAADEILFVSSNGWDACGAKWFGYVSFWVNRARAPAERLGVAPDGEGRSLMAAADFYLQWAEAAAAR